MPMTDETRVLPTTKIVPRRRRRSRGRRWVLGILVVLVLLAAALVAMVTFLDLRMGDAGTLSSLAPGQGTYLLVGTDSRENLPDDLEGSFGDFSGSRADVIILAQVVDGRRQLLSIPRDLKVDIDGQGTNRVNAALALGGPELLVGTVSDATGTPIHHYLEVDFGGFAGVVDSLGGIELNFEHPARDAKSGLEVDDAGLQVVNGATALAYARSRGYEELRDGEWQAGDQGDLARTRRQQEVLVEILGKASSPGGLVRSPGVVASVSENLTGDSDLTPLVLLRTGWAMRSAGTTELATLPVVGAPEDGVAYLARDEPAATEMLDAFREGRPLPGTGE